jgi:2-keto-4-pentenoate hydratase/2-oxohepta-3-ene-1,7-dioic acid hydratase in catechol pathway
MRLYSVLQGDVAHVGVETEFGRVAIIPHSVVGGMQALIDGGATGLAAVERWASSATTVALTEITGLAPLPVPVRDVICVGKNYHEHANEFHRSGFDSTSAQAIPDAPVIFTKATTSIAANGAQIRASIDPTKTIDYEGELGVVIGIGGTAIAPEQAYRHVFGYTVINDVTSRALQKRHGQWFVGKSLDGFCPMGPCIVTADEVDAVDDLLLTTHVNGELRQQARVSDLIFDIPTLIATLSSTMTLVPGDIIATGTPAGVGIGFEPPKYLSSGDRVRVEISGIGILENAIV